MEKHFHVNCQQKLKWKFLFGFIYRREWDSVYEDIALVYIKNRG